MLDLTRPDPPLRKPDWLKVKLAHGENYDGTRPQDRSTRQDPVTPDGFQRG